MIQYIVNTKEDRLETGVVQDRTDWPGYFIRGDNALNLAMTLELSLREDSNPLWYKTQIESFIGELLEVAQRDNELGWETE